MNEEKSGAWLRRTKHIHGHLWHWYCVTVKQVMAAILEFWYEITRQFNVIIRVNSIEFKKFPILYGLDINNQYGCCRVSWIEVAGSYRAMGVLRHFQQYVNFPFICSNIPAAPAYGVYISQLIFQSLWFLSGFWLRVAANKEATEPRVPLG